MLEYRHLINHPDPAIRKQWQLSGANKFRRTMQGVGKSRNKEDRVEGTDTMHLIHKRDIPKNNLRSPMPDSSVKYDYRKQK
jgi:hypothetical protein